jgi:membrane protein YqaA with SNARE-associated domain
MTEYLLLFASAFLAATLLPVSSEVVLAALTFAQAEEIWFLVALASLGNTLGALVNWILGRFLYRFRDRRWYPLTPKRHEQAAAWFRRFGIWSLLLAWVPIVGDPLTLVAGLARVKILPFLLLVGVGKTVRYLAVAFSSAALAA